VFKLILIVSNPASLYPEVEKLPILLLKVSKDVYKKRKKGSRI